MSFYRRSHDEEQRDVVISSLSNEMTMLLLLARYDKAKTKVTSAMVKS